jgi:GNAT superfamily N-acetyltransferase
MITYARETLFDVVEEVDGLLRLHYDELTLNKDAIRLDPVWEEYRALESMGRFVLFTARANGALVGYNAFFVTRHIHYAALTMAINDVLFLHPDHRRGSTGIKLLKFAEAELKAQGVQKVSYHVKRSLDWSPILHRMGYTDEEMVVGKLLQGE